jgi:hypothetical protein
MGGRVGEPLPSYFRTSPKVGAAEHRPCRNTKDLQWLARDGGPITASVLVRPTDSMKTRPLASFGSVSSGGLGAGCLTRVAPLPTQ